MFTAHGVIQEYNGIEAVDDKHQLIIFADTYDDVNESGHLTEILDGIDEVCKYLQIDDHIYKHVIVSNQLIFPEFKYSLVMCTKGMDRKHGEHKFKGVLADLL